MRADFYLLFKYAAAVKNLFGLYHYYIIVINFVLNYNYRSNYFNFVEAVMNIQYLIFFGVFFAIYGSVNFYIGIRGWQAFGRLFPTGYGFIYWLLFAVLSLSFIAGRFAEKY